MCFNKKAVCTYLLLLPHLLFPSRCSFIFHHLTCSCNHPPTIPTNNSLLYFSQFWPSYFISLLVHKIIPTISTNTPFLYILTFFCLPIFVYSHPSNPHQKFFLLLQPFSQFRLFQGMTLLNISMFTWSLDRNRSADNHWFPIFSDKENWCSTGSCLWWRC